MRWLIVASLGVVCCLAGPTSASPNSTRRGQAVMIDTDIMSDVDDVGALAVANVLQNCGLADVRGITINTHSRYGALVTSVINTYFGNGEIPIAAIRPLTNEHFFDTFRHLRGEFASKVAFNWPRQLKDVDSTPTPVELYRSVLSSTTNKSIHLISIGFLKNIAELLRSSGDDISPMSGPDLISASVSELIVMGGSYPSGWEFNFGGQDPEDTAFVLNNWPETVPVTFSGSELGGNIFSGHQLREHSPPDSPVLAAYEWYMGRCSTVQKSWDPITVLYGVLGLKGFEKISIQTPLKFANTYGYNSIVSENASNSWVNDTTVTNQHWLELEDGVSNSSMAWLLDQFYVHDPMASCGFGVEGNYIQVQ